MDNLEVSNHEGQGLRVRQVLSITVLMCMGGLVLTFLATVLLKGLWGWDDAVLQGKLSEGAAESEVWKVRLIAALNQMFVFLLPALGTLWLLRSSMPVMLRKVSLRVWPNWHLLGLSIALLIVSMPLVFYAYQINKLVPLPPEMTAAAEMANEAIKALMKMPDVWAFLANLTLIALLPAFGEELLFRGILQNQLMRRMPSLTAILLTGALFSLMHFQMDGFLPRWLLGVVLGWTYWRTRNFWVPVILHFLNNGVQVAAQYFYAQGQSAIDLSENEVAVPVPLILLALGLTWLLIRMFSQTAPAVRQGSNGQ
jgi:uncharacterized protein